MERTQVQFDAELAAALKRRATQQGVSVSAVVREAVTAYLQGEASSGRLERALAAGGAFSSGVSDVSAEHDRYLADGFLA